MEYLLRDVKHEEYNALKKLEEELVTSALDGFNGSFNHRIQDIRATFLYNPNGQYIGIFMDRDKDFVLAGGLIPLSLDEEMIAESLYQKLEEKLTQIRLPNER